MGALRRTAAAATSALEAFAAAAPGLESLVAGELKALGIAPRAEAGGVGFRGTIEAVARANLWLRTANRVLVRVAAFRAQAFHELERLARAIPWERYLTAGAPVRFRVTSRKSRLYHTGAIEQRFAEAIEHRLGKASEVESSTEDDDTGPASSPAQLFVIRVVNDAFTVSVDSSGALLHQRGYRQAVAKAPLRETLAAAMLIAADWTGATPLIDPFCGSGTIPIEAALLARRIAPGRARNFAFPTWPEVKSSIWAKVREDAEGVARPRSPVEIRGSDRDRGAIEASIGNAERAGVASDIEFSVRAVSAVEKTTTETVGLVVTNPPYGVRMGEAERLRDLYARLGQVLRTECPGWEVVMLSANARLEKELRLSLRELLHTRNGGIPVKLLTATIPAPVGR